MSDGKTPEIWLTAQAIADSIGVTKKDVAARVSMWRSRKKEATVSGSTKEYLCPPDFQQVLRERVANIVRRPNRKKGQQSLPLAAPAPAPAKPTTPVKTDEERIMKSSSLISELSRSSHYDQGRIPRVEDGNIDMTLLYEVCVYHMMKNKRHYFYVRDALQAFPPDQRDRLFDEITREAGRRNWKIDQQAQQNDHKPMGVVV